MEIKEVENEEKFIYSNINGNEPIRLSQPLQFRIVRSSRKKNRKPFGLRIRAQSSDPIDEQKNYWIVKRSRPWISKKDIDICQIGQVDITSVFGFRDAVGKHVTFDQNGAKGRKEQGVFVRFNQLITLFTNHELGPRFLTAQLKVQAKSKCIPLEWSMSAEDIQQSINSSHANQQFQFIIRKASEYQGLFDRKSQSSAVEREDGDVVQFGDNILLESVDFPGYFVKPYRNLNVLMFGPEKAIIEVISPSLQFAIQLNEKKKTQNHQDFAPRSIKVWLGKTSLFGKFDSKSDRDTEKTNSIRQRSISHVSEKELYLNSKFQIRTSHSFPNDMTYYEEPKKKFSSIQNVLPYEILKHIMSFFQGCELPKNLQENNHFAIQKWYDSLPHSRRQNGVDSLRSCREVNHLWYKIASECFTSVRIGDKLGFIVCSTSRQDQNMLTNILTSCKNIYILKMQNFDFVTAFDRKLSFILSLKHLKRLSLGGCPWVDDEIIEEIGEIPLIHLNIAMAGITDYGLKVLAESCAGRTLMTLNLYGVQRISEVGVEYAVTRMPKLSSLNLRGTTLSYDWVMRMKRSIQRKENEWEVLTGPFLSESIYGIPR